MHNNNRFAHLWTTRCNLIHTRESGGLYIEDENILHKDVREQWELGPQNLAESQKYLFRTSLEDIMEKPLDWIRGWLIEVLIARGEIICARNEMKRNRHGKDYTRSDITNTDLERRNVLRKKRQRIQN